MNGKASSFAKGMGMGAILGAAVYIGGRMVVKNSNMMSMNSKSMRKKISHAAKNAGEIMDNVSYILK